MFYKKSLSDDIKLANSKFKKNKVLEVLYYLGVSVIGAAVAAGILFVAVPIAISGSPVYATLLMVSTGGIGLALVNNIEHKYKKQTDENSYNFKKYVAEQRIEALSEKLKENGIDVSYEKIVNATDIDIEHPLRATIMGSEKKEEHLFIFDPHKYEYLKQEEKKIKYLRDRVVRYSEIEYTATEKNKVKCKRI